MNKRTILKLSLFAFISAIICFIGNTILSLNILSYIIQGTMFLAYLFFAIWLCQLVYGKTRFSKNLVILMMSFALAVYSFLLISITSTELLLEYYVIFFYVLVLIFLVSSIVLIGRMMFSSPKSKLNEKERIAETTYLPEKSTWTCSCGCTNTGKFCSECGKPNVATEISQTSEILE